MVLFLVVVVVSLVSDFFLLDLSDFLDFVVVDVENLSVEGLLIKLLSGECSIVWVLEADEGVDSFTFFTEDLNAFDLTALSEVLSELLFGGVGWEVLNVEIASLLGVLESHLVLLLFLFSFGFLKGFSDVELAVWCDFFLVKVVDSIHGSLGTVFFVKWVL